MAVCRWICKSRESSPFASPLLTLVTSRTVSMTLGRPPYLHMDEGVPLPLAIDDEYLPLDGQHTGQPEGTYSTSLFTVENIKLAKILGKILGRVYQRYGKAGTSAGSLQDPTLTHDDLNVMLHIDSQLEDCVDSLPRSLRWDTATRSNEDIPPVLKRQSNVLRARPVSPPALFYAW